MINQFEFLARANAAIAQIALRDNLIIQKVEVSRDDIIMTFHITKDDVRRKMYFYSLAHIEGYAK